MRFAVLNPGQISLAGLASFAFARHYSRNLGWFLFLALLRCFSSGGSPHIPMDSVYDAWPYPCGLLHSEICGSKLAYSSPQLIAVNHVLHRLPMPRHSLCALYCFTICFLVHIFAFSWITLLVVVFYPTWNFHFLSFLLTRSFLICILLNFSILFSSFLLSLLRTDIKR